MKITGIELGRMRIPLKRPFKTALRTVTDVDDIVVRVTTDEGICGFGEAPPTAVITGDTRGSIACAIHDFIAPALVGMEIDCLEAVMERLEGSMVHNTSAKAAVDMAIYDLYAKLHGAPLYKLLGGYRDTVTTDVTISVNPVDEMVADSLAAVSDGFTILKIKVGKEGLADVPRIAAIRKAVGPDVAIRVDANQGWSAKDSIRIIHAMEDAGLAIELVEQPVPAGDFAGMVRVTQSVSTPILADECVFTPADAVRLIEAGAADMINIKLMKAGGIHPALRICAVAEAYHVPCMIGCMLESKLAVSAAAHLAAGRRIIQLADLDGPALCAHDPLPGGPLYQGPHIHMQAAPGLGITALPADIEDVFG